MKWRGSDTLRLDSGFKSLPKFSRYLPRYFCHLLCNFVLPGCAKHDPYAGFGEGIPVDYTEVCLQLWIADYGPKIPEARPPFTPDPIMYSECGHTVRKSYRS